VEYRVEFARAAKRQFDCLPKQVQVRLKRRIESLKDNPRPHGAKKLAGADDLYRIRDGEYRIIYTIKDKELIVLVVKIGHRREVYRKK